MVNFTSKLQLTEATNQKISPSGSKQRLSKIKDATAVCNATPIHGKKRQHHAIVSPITTNKERMSPKAKYQMMEKSAKLELNKSYSSPLQYKFPFLLDTLTSVVSKNVAVPLTAAEPPSPSLLPSPPRCWVAETNVGKLVEKRRCLDVTQSLIMHLASSGILVTA